MRQVAFDQSRGGADVVAIPIAEAAPDEWRKVVTPK
jgi:hypothetical protein